MALFAVFDVETTGLSPAQGDRVVEIAVVILDEQFRVVRMFDSLVHPQRSISSQVTQIHGISNRDIQQAPTFADLLPDLMSCLAGSTHIVAHNISFDLQFLRAELLACGLQMPQSFGRLCTMQMARQKRVARNARLSTVASALQIPSIADAHRAIVDAGVTARVLSLLHDQRNSSKQSPIQWPNHEPASGCGRQFPRHSLGCATNSNIDNFPLGKVVDFCSISAIESGLFFGSNGMHTTTTTSEYKSPVKKLAAFFEKARDNWKAKYIAKRDQAILLANQVRAVEKSREHWKSVAQEARRELQQMKQSQKKN